MSIRANVVVEDPRVRRAGANLAAWQIATALIAIGLVLLSVAEAAKGRGEAPTWDAVLRDLGSLSIATGALSVLWDLLGRRALMDEALDAAHIGSDVQAARLRRVGRYLDVPWERFLDDAKEVDLFFTYAAAWRSTHDAALRRLVKRNGTRIRVVVPDLDNEPLLERLAAKFGYTVDKVRERIREAEEDLTAIAAETVATSTLELRRTSEFPVYTYYRFDGVAVTALYGQAQGRVEVPSFVYAQGGSLYDFFWEQFKRLWEGASVRPLEEN